MNIVTDPNGWNEEVLRRGGGFLQSWEWGTFQEKAGHRVVRLRSDGATGQFIEHRLPLGRSYWYAPRGPLGSAAAFTSAKAFSGATFLRVEPGDAPADSIRVASVQPSQTLVLDLTKDEEELLAGMHEKTRYNIRLAERKGVKVYEASPKDFDVFWSVMQETATRDAFRQHGKEHYRLMLEAFPFAKLMFAEHDGRVLAANLMVHFGDTATYLHGASSNARREVMAPHLLHWECIRRAKAAGIARYDFWGVAPADAGPDHSWAGITRFKRGFGGTYVEYPGTFDIPLDGFWYGVYRALRRLRR